MEHNIKRAIIVAAGKGERLRPLTYETPKPLIEVNGIRMIESCIEALHQNGIVEIYIVIGYQKEKFSYLPDKYQGITLLENPYYDTCNNISSLYVARNHLEDVMILDGDQMIYHPSILQPTFTYSGYHCIYTNEPTKEWVLTVDKNHHVLSCSRTGGPKGWQLHSISRWNQKDGQTLRECLTYEFEEKKNTQIFWDDVALFYHPERFQLGIYPMEKGDMLEIDTYEELCEVDDTYKRII